MARKPARFRISIKDNRSGHALKIELLDWIGGSYEIRQNGVRATRIPHGTLSVVCARVRRWLVAQVKASRRRHCPHSAAIPTCRRTSQYTSNFPGEEK